VAFLNTDLVYIIWYENRHAVYKLNQNRDYLSGRKIAFRLFIVRVILRAPNKLSILSDLAGTFFGK